MFEIGKIRNKEFQCLEQAKFIIPMFGKAKNKEFQRLEYAKFTIPMLIRTKIKNSMFGINKIHNSNGWKNQK